MRHPEGRQVILRTSDSGKEAIIVCHTFSNPPETPLKISIPGDMGWTLVESLNDLDYIEISGSDIVIRPMNAFTGGVYYITA